MRYTREQLAEQLSLGVRRRRLERIGEPTDGPVVAFDSLPEDDQQTWLDCADAAIELLLSAARDTTDHGGLPPGPMNAAISAAHDRLVEEGVTDPAMILIVEGDRPDGTGWGRTLASTVKNPLEMLKLVMPQVEAASRSGS